ncbi:MAG: hypothetical protein AB7F65_09620 [Dehalococcoidia bacterium]
MTGSDRRPPLPVRAWLAWRQGVLIETILRRLPPRVAAFVDRFRADARDPLGGPMNGQVGRRAMIESLFAAVPFGAVVETGTFRGSTTAYFASLTSAPVFTIEVQPRFHAYSRWRLRGRRTIRLLLGDSAEWVDRLGRNGGVREPVFFYLDAHWEERIPLRDELRAAQQHWRDWVILVDDFEVPDDPGYGFDDYGEGKRLNLEHIEAVIGERAVRYWPSVRSADEAGSRKGCLVLVSESLAATVDQLHTLRRG